MSDVAVYRRYEKGVLPLLKKYGGELITYDDAAFALEGTSPRTGRMILPTTKRCASTDAPAPNWSS